VRIIADPTGSEPITAPHVAKALYVLRSFLRDSQIGVDGVDRTLTHIAVAEVRAGVSL
jgi:hypothetical protein